MKRAQRGAPAVLLGVGVLLASAASFAACGDDDDDGEVPANTGGTEMTDTTEMMTDTTEMMTDTTEMMTDTTGG
jgi:hypothetical protein